MWLWKKFKDTDIIGKIYILIILFIVIVATINVITRYTNASTNQVVKDKQDEIIQEVDLTEQNLTIDDTITVTEVEDETINEEAIKINVETKEQEKSTISTDNKSTEQTISKEETKVTVNKEQISNNETQTNKKEEVKQEEQQTEQKEDKQQVQESEKKEDTNQEEQETNKQEDKQDIAEKEETTSHEVVRTVKRNDTYIQKMKNYITTNDKSSYSIVVDESIVNNTYGFTYSEFNMSGYLGCYSTYRIYAQDYYVNGEFVETRCYID